MNRHGSIGRLEFAKKDSCSVMCRNVCANNFCVETRAAQECVAQHRIAPGLTEATVGQNGYSSILWLNESESKRLVWSLRPRETTLMKQLHFK